MKFPRLRMMAARSVMKLAPRAVRLAGSLFHLAAWCVGQRAAVHMDLTIGPRVEPENEPDWSKAFLVLNLVDQGYYLVTPQTVDFHTMDPPSDVVH